jgi:hypothetical protein
VFDSSYKQFGYLVNLILHLKMPFLTKENTQVAIIKNGWLKHCWQTVVACAAKYEKHIKDSETGNWSA